MKGRMGARLPDEAAFLVYMPVYHRGFAALFARHPEVKKLILLRREELAEFGPTGKDIHAVETVELGQMLAALGRWEEIAAGGGRAETRMALVGVRRLIIPRDEAIRHWVEKYWRREGLTAPGEIVEEEIFLRWTREKAVEKKKVGGVGGAPYQRRAPGGMEKFLQEAQLESEKSSDWWRQVGCVLILADGTVIRAHNRHLPEAQTPYILGDARAQFHKGEQIELTTAIHAEAAAIAQAAKEGRGTAGAQLLVTDFPCPVCARLIAAAGISEVYFQRGYSMLDGEEILQGAGVKIRQIK